MLLAPLAVLALVVGGFASSSKTASELVVSFASRDTIIQSIDQLFLIAEIQNTGNTNVKILNFATIFDAHRPTRSFVVTKDGAEVAFTGVAMSVDLELLDDSAFTTILAGESITVKHTNLGSIYDFESAGTGTFAFQPISIFRIIDETSFTEDKVDQLVQLEATSSPVMVTILDDVSKLDIPKKRAVISCPNVPQKNFITAAYTEAKSLASVSSSWIASNSGDALFTSYWGTNSASTMQSRFNLIANENSPTRIDPYALCTSGVIAYTHLPTSNIYFCPLFYNQAPITQICTSTTIPPSNLRGGTVFRELVRAILSTEEYVYGCSAAQGLSTALKLRNTDNYYVSGDLLVFAGFKSAL
ncbi:hypothetical protein BDV98DRAFT_605353 [Pterulicium gracile]|uniref:Neutral protease 2 n=1 Tax=Pterulicium gracile TaxID=1884261 RepID=A0A5C3QEW4_9AGAR|nr:hypothetical protein BDV98DRAFT_605353 [Pterula gracilis]